MKKNRRARIYKVLTIGLPFYTLIFFSLSSISNTRESRADSISCFPIPQLCTPTPTPSPIPSPTPSPTPKPIPSPTQPPKPTPTQIQQLQPINAVPTIVASVVATATPAPATPTVTIVNTVTATPTKVTVANGDTNQQPQGAANQGISIFALSLGIGAPLLLISGAMVWLLWRKQVTQFQPVQQRLSHHTQPAPWLNNNSQAPLWPGSNPPTTPWPNDTSQATPWSNNVSQATSWPDNHDMPTMPETAHYAPSPLPAAGMSEAALYPASELLTPSPQATYTPSDLRPMTSAFPRQVLTMSPSNGASSAQNGDLEPLSMDALNLPLQPSKTGTSSFWDEPTPITPASLIDNPISPAPSPLPPTPVSPQTIQPPSIKEDPVLEEVMRQAQMGLFALSRR